MVLYGLIVPLVHLCANLELYLDDHAVSDAGGGLPDVTKYLVPALLPMAPAEVSHGKWSDRSFNSCLFFFATSDIPDDLLALCLDECRKFGFLPRGVFERVIAMIVTWCQAGGANISSHIIYKDYALFSINSNRFRLRASYPLNAILFDCETVCCRDVYSRVSDLISRVLQNIMRSLRCNTLFAHPNVQEIFANTTMFIPLTHLKRVNQGCSVLNRPGGRTLISAQEVLTKYGVWFTADVIPECYDMFGSYRWGEFESEFMRAVFDRFGYYTIGETNRSVIMFLDTKRLRDGCHLQEAFARALIKSVVFVPLLSSAALRRMCSHDPFLEDNVLKEWMLAVEVIRYDRSPLQRIYPLVAGHRDDLTGHISPLTIPNSSLPVVVPTASIARVKSLLASSGITPSSSMETYTVQSIVTEIRRYLYFDLTTAKQPQLPYLVAESCHRIMKVLRDCTDSRPHMTLQSPVPAAAPTRPAAPIPQV
jgi:hypothetical protein